MKEKRILIGGPCNGREVLCESEDTRVICPRVSKEGLVFAIYKRSAGQSDFIFVGIEED